MDFYLLKRSFIKAAGRFAICNRQGVGREMVNLWQKVEAAILQRNVTRHADHPSDDEVTDPLIVEIAEIRARLRRIEDLFDHAGTSEIEQAIFSPPTMLFPLSPGDQVDASVYLPMLSGFYPLEIEPSGSVFRWTGPQHEFIIDIDIDRSRLARFELRLSGGLQGGQCEGLGLIVDKAWVPVTVNVDKTGYNVRFALQPRSKGGGTTLMFVVPQLYRPVDLDMGGDDRWLGVRFRSLVFLDK